MTGDWSWEHFYTCDLITFYFNPSIGCCCCCYCCCSHCCVVVVVVVVVVVAVAAAAAAAGNVALFCFCLFVSWAWEEGLLVVFVFWLFVVLKLFCGCCCCVLLGGGGGVAGGGRGNV